MKLMSVNHENNYIAKLEANERTKLGYLGTTSLRIDHICRPKTLPFRNIPLARKDQVKSELDQLVQQDK